jgi:hypothetical protein
MKKFMYIARLKDGTVLKGVHTGDIKDLKLQQVTDKNPLAVLRTKEVKC